MNDTEPYVLSRDGDVLGIRMQEITVTALEACRTSIGNVGLARFGNIAGLRPSGNAQFVVTEESGPAIIGVPMGDGYGQIIQGHLESSNAVIADELVKLMRAQQAYAGSSRLLQSAVEMSKRLTS